MTDTRSSAEIKSKKLRQIKLLHTVVWAIMAASILAIPWTAWLERFRLALGLTLLVLGECLVLAVNHGRCPLTDVAAHHTDERGPNFDIYLPVWLARYNKFIFGLLFAAGELVLQWHWVRRTQP